MGRPTRPAPFTGAIIIPDRLKATGSPFSDLLRKPSDFMLCCKGIERALAVSFAEDEARGGPGYRARVQTETEQKRRAEICGQWFRRLRGDLGYSITSTLDELPRALRATLDEDSTYQPPPKGRLHVASVGARNLEADA
jgi:hypothetical protein